ncbi:uncharacterized protein TrAtP1_003783 [Trichoderma atroviride]|uniref:uncharacterized protein n=1 Tax=Hypocrea atroviridis TaxID=63577 RepID=UPI003330F5B3|nr:hypothetical protein TrAtP1_003783 [Trichoderma atroviride]
MPVPEPRINEAEERLDLLESIHSYFTCCLPTLEDIKNGRFSVSSGDTLGNLDAITLLRTDIKYLPITLQYINIEQAARDNNIDRLISAFDPLLALFEESVQIEEKSDENVTLQQGIESFPKLISLRSLRPQFDISREDSDIPKTKTDAEFAAFGDTSAAGAQQPVPSLNNPGSYINFPPPQKTVIACQRVVESFGQAIDDIFTGGVRQWNVESLCKRSPKMR